MEGPLNFKAANWATVAVPVVPSWWMTVCFWVFGSALDAAFMSSVLDDAVA